jgi:hypothetical protein
MVISHANNNERFIGIALGFRAPREFEAFTFLI